MSAFNWTCPHCDRDQTVTSERICIRDVPIVLDDIAIPRSGCQVTAIACANPNCRKVELSFLWGVRETSGSGWKLTKNLGYWRLIPESSAKPQPDYIPSPIREDYYEACRIRDLSPKASATLARRCLQGMIRDFCAISGARLIDEIRELRAALDDGRAPAGVTAESVEAIDHVREIGNIGAHMEKDINLIVDVEPREAQLLIGLIELLFKEWYVARESRRAQLAALQRLAADKKAERQQTPLLALAEQSPVLDGAAEES